MATLGEIEVKNSYLRWALEAHVNQKDEYEKYQDYYEGEHPLMFSTTRWREAFGNDFKDFRDNWCPVVADSLHQRLEIIGWECDRDASAAKLANDIWNDEFIDQEEDELHLGTIIKGDGYLIVWPDEDDDQGFYGTSGINMYYNDALNTSVHYSNQNLRKIDRASKVWVEDDGAVRITLYFADRIERYRIKPEASISVPQIALESGMVPDGIETLPDGWTRLSNEKNPYGRVPVFHFKNRTTQSTHGMSELKAVIPIQGMLNKMLMDISLGSEFAGYPAKWMSGGGHPSDGWKTGPNRMFATTDPNARFGQFDAMEFDGPRGIVELLVGHVAKTTQTPMHFLRTSGDMPSGEALKVAESGLVQKAKNRQKRWKHPWGHAMAFAVAIKRIKDEGQTPTPELVKEALPKGPLHPIWQSPETRHDLEQAQVAQLKSILGVPLKIIWKEHFGYNDDQIKEMEKINAVVAASTLAQVLTQSGQAAPGASVTLAELLGGGQGGTGAGGGVVDLAGMTIPQILAQLSKSQTSKTTAGEATTNPQANTRPPASPTRRSSGFKD